MQEKAKIAAAADEKVRPGAVVFEWFWDVLIRGIPEVSEI